MSRHTFRTDLLRFGLFTLTIALVTILVATLSTTACAEERAGIRIERIFGPEIRTGPYKHPACFDQLQNGDLYLVYYGGEGEYATNTAVFGSRLAKDSKNWTSPVPIARNPLYSVGNGVVW